MSPIPCSLAIVHPVDNSRFYTYNYVFNYETISISDPFPYIFYHNLVSLTKCPSSQGLSCVLFFCYYRMEPACPS